MTSDPQLKHVCMLTMDGLISVKAEEVIEKYPDIAGDAKSKNFICELCGKYVILVNGKKRRPFFKHNRGDEDKECPERAEGMPGYKEFLNGMYIPRVRGIFNDNKVVFKIGINHDFFDKKKSIKSIIITVNSNKRYTYDVLERIHDDGISYLDIGVNLINEIKIDLLKFEDDKQICWLPTLSLMSDRGALFIYENGKYIIYDSDIFIGEKYDYLGKSPIRLMKGMAILKEEYIGIGNERYCHQVIRMTDLTIELIRFFKHELNYRLNNAIASYVHLWPEYVRYDNELVVNGEKLFTILYGNNKILCKRNGVSITKECNFIEIPNDSNYGLGEINCYNYKSLIIIGRTKAFDYAYFQQGVILEEFDYPSINIKDESGNCVLDGEQEKLPINKCLIIESDYRYIVKIIRDGWTIEKKNYNEKKKIYVDFGDTIEVYQGLDLRFRIEYRKPKKKYCNKELYSKINRQRGNDIHVDVSMREVCKYFLDDKPIYRWLQKQYRLGKIPKGAIQLLQCSIKEKLRRGMRK